MWEALWRAVENATGKPVKFKFLHGTGLRAIVVDGCKPQVDACGDVLVRLNDPKVSGIHEQDPQQIVWYVVRTCTVHLQWCVVRVYCPRMLKVIRASYPSLSRAFDRLANAGCSPDVMHRLKQFMYLKTDEELAEFTKWCEESSHKVLRGMFSSC